MAIKIFVQIETSIDEHFSRIDNATLILDDESLAQFASAIAAQQKACSRTELSDFACTCGKCEPLEGNEEFCANTHLPIPQRH